MEPGKKPYCPDWKPQTEKAAKLSWRMSLWELNVSRAWDKKRCSPVTYLTMFGLPVSAIGVGQVAVLVPPAAMMRQGTVAEGNIIVSVKSCKLPSVVVSKSVPCRREERPSFTAERVTTLWPERGVSRKLSSHENDQDPVSYVTGLLSQNGQDKDRIQMTQSLACSAIQTSGLFLQSPSEHSI